MATAATVADGETATPQGSLRVLALGALGVVYGDLGTSPLYTLKTALDWAGGATPAVAVGMLSLIIWTLLVTTSFKYVAVVMRADNDGEGGILALMSLLGIKHGERVGVIAIGVLGAALLYGDGAITPAISVLSALEGLRLPVPEIEPYIVPLSALVLVGLFALQSQGSGRIGKLFGPIMTAWFVAIGLLGLGGIVKTSGRAGGPRPAPWVRLPAGARIHGFSCSWCGVSVRHRRRGALRRHGSLRAATDPVRLVRPSASHPRAQLRRPDRHRGRRRGCCRD